MPSQPNPENTTIHFRLSRILRLKIEKMAEAAGTTMTALITTWVIEGTAHVNLTPEEYEEIAAQIRKARQK